MSGRTTTPPSGGRTLRRRRSGSSQREREREKREREKSRALESHAHTHISKKKCLFLVSGVSVAMPIPWHASPFLEKRAERQNLMHTHTCVFVSGSGRILSQRPSLGMHHRCLSPRQPIFSHMSHTPFLPYPRIQFGTFFSLSLQPLFVRCRPPLSPISQHFIRFFLSPTPFLPHVAHPFFPYPRI